MIRYLIISILIGVCLSSCALKTTQGLRQIPFTKTEVENPYFSNPNIDHIYKAKIEAYGKNFGGVFYIKKTGRGRHRVVITTEFGNKILDFEYNADQFTKKYIIPDLDRKFIVDVLKEDFRLLINTKAKVTSVYDNERSLIYETVAEDGFNFYFVEKRTGILERILHTSKTKEKVEINFESAVGNIAESIRITHNDIKLSIDLEKLDQD